MSHQAFKNVRVLLVEDNPHMRRLLGSLLRAIGFQNIIESNDGSAGLSAIKDVSPDLVLVDLEMRPLDGIEFTRHVRTSDDSPCPYIPIIMVTGHSARLKVEEARDAGVSEFLAKPVTGKGLFSRVQEVILRPRPFIQCAGFFGPDRRRRDNPKFAGPYLRATDNANDQDTFEVL
jgi:CheY-like chemotaxis protein